MNKYQILQEELKYHKCKFCQGHGTYSKIATPSKVVYMKSARICFYCNGTGFYKLMNAKDLIKRLCTISKESYNTKEYYNKK